MKTTSFIYILPVLFVVLSCSTPSQNQEMNSGTHSGSNMCKNPRANEIFSQGFKLQEKQRSDQAIQSYLACLKIENRCRSCQYELGWSYWSQSQWEKTVGVWSKLYQQVPDFPGLKTYLDQAQEKFEVASGGEPSQSHQSVEIGINSRPETNQIEMKLVHRFQQYNRSPKVASDQFDTDIHSPKSVQFSKDGKTAYVNSLEGYRTVIYQTQPPKKKGTISHQFDASRSSLFKESAPFSYFYRTPPPEQNPNIFSGKPVESALSHDGKFLWVPYYRRDFDKKGTSPSAVSIINTETNQIERVMATGPISKYVTASNDHRWVAISHWGDNTVDLIRTPGDQPETFYHAYHLPVEEAMDLDQELGDRDKECGFCLRGMTFSSNSKYLFVARMSGGGIAIFQLAKQQKPKYLGTVFGFRPTPRDIHTSPNGEWTYISSNISGYVSKVKTKELIGAAIKSNGGRSVFKKLPGTYFEAFVGPGARSIRLSPDSKYIFAAINLESKLTLLRESDLKILEEVPVDSYPVGLDIHPSGKQVWVTSQGRNRKGGNSVSIYSVSYSKRNRL